MASRPYLTTGEREALYKEIASLMLEEVTAVRKDHPERAKDVARVAATDSSHIMGFTKLFAILNRYDFVPKKRSRD